jgi:hypothetical protein
MTSPGRAMMAALEMVLKGAVLDPGLLSLPCLDTWYSLAFTTRVKQHIRVKNNLVIRIVKTIS